MKQKSLLPALFLLFVGVTLGGTLYVSAQEEGGQSLLASLMDRFQQPEKTFDYAAELNPSDNAADLKSEPVEGKKKGGKLTAAEFNRVLEMLNEGGGSDSNGGEGGGTWVDIDLNGTDDFNKECNYRFKLTPYAPYVPVWGADPYYYISAIETNRLVYIAHSTRISHINSDSKTLFRENGAVNTTITLIQENCGGAGSGSGGGGGTCEGVVADLPDAIICESGDDREALYYQETLGNEVYYGTVGSLSGGARLQDINSSIYFDKDSGNYLGVKNDFNITGFGGCSGKSLADLEAEGNAVDFCGGGNGSRDSSFPTCSEGEALVADASGQLGCRVPSGALLASGEFFNDSSRSSGTVDLEDSFTITEPGILQLHGYSTRNKTGSTATNTGMTAMLYIDGDVCSIDRTFEAQSINMAYSAASSCSKVLAPGSYSVKLESNDYGSGTNSKHLESKMNYVVTRQ